MSTAVDTTVALTGILPAVMIASTVLTALVAVFLLWLYRRAVMRDMDTTSGAADMRAPSGTLEAKPDARCSCHRQSFGAGCHRAVRAASPGGFYRVRGLRLGSAALDWPAIPIETDK